MKLGVPPLPTGPAIPEIADWAELVAFKRGQLTRGKLSTAVLRNDGSETDVADAWHVLEARAEISKDGWSFAVDSISLRPKPEHADGVLPAFFAALGLRENIENSHRALFEQCVAEIIESILPGSIRLGHPRRPPIPSSFRDAFAQYVDQANEKVVREPPASDNDLGMDVVAWWPFQDRRGGYLHLVGQCATGADWEDKLDDLNLEVIEDHVNWTVKPLRFFATPHVVPTQKMRRVSKRAGLVLDRPRLVELERKRQLTSETRREVADALANLYS